jgi:hypothetical protein
MKLFLHKVTAKTGSLKLSLLFGLVLFGTALVSVTSAQKSYAATSDPPVIVAADGQGNIYISNASGPSTVIKAANSTIPLSLNTPMLPTYAQNSSKIFYITPGMSGNGPRLNSISPSGLNDTVVATLPDSTYPTSMAWSDAANDFVISDGISQAYTITAYGTGYTKIFTGEASAEAWSPNGQVIAIEGKSGVYTINANGTDQRMVISADTCMTTDRSNISWDGNSKLIVGCNDGSNYSVVQSDAGVLTTILSGNGSTIDSLSASPNGSYIAYILTGAFGSGETGESVYTDSLVVANSTPTLIYQIGQVASYAILGAATSWLPDSSAFVFTGPNYENPAIHISSPSGDVRQIVDTESPGNPVLALSTNSGASEIASSPEPVGMTGTKTSLAFDDEFSGTALDTSKWTPNKGGTAGQLIPAANEVPDIFDPAQVSVSNGSLNLGAISQVRNINGVTYDYSSGAAWTGNGGFTVAPTATAPVTMEARIYLTVKWLIGLLSGQAAILGHKMARLMFWRVLAEKQATIFTIKVA